MIFWNPGSRDVFSFSSAKNNGGGWFLWKKHRFCCKCMYFPKAWFHHWHLYISTIAGNLFTISIKTSRATSSIGSWWLSTLSYLLNFFAFYFAEKKKHPPSIRRLLYRSGNFLHGPIELLSKGAMSTLCNRAEVRNPRKRGQNPSGDPHTKVVFFFEPEVYKKTIQKKTRNCSERLRHGFFLSF